MEGAVLRKRKRKHNWKPVSLDSAEFFEGDLEGFVSLEVLEGEDLDEYETGKIIKEGQEDIQCDFTVMKFYL